MLGPVLGVGAAAAGGAAAVFGRMMTGCPRSRPCPVGFPIHFFTFSCINLLQRRDPMIPLRLKCCRLVGSASGRQRCPRQC